MVRIVRATQVEIEAAVQALRDGELVAFPTETVYGLGANAQNPAAVRKIFEAKGRPTTHPVIVHLDSPRFLHRWVREVPERGQQLAERFWPGPLTLVLPRAPQRARHRHRRPGHGRHPRARRIRWRSSCSPPSAAASPRRPPTATAACRPRAPSTCARSSAMRCASFSTAASARSGSSRPSSPSKASRCACCARAASPPRRSAKWSATC